MSSSSVRIAWLRVAAAVLGLAVIVSGLSFAAAPDDEPKKEEKKGEPKKEAPQKDKINKNLPVPGAPFEEIFKNLPQGVDPEQMRKMQAEMQRMMQEMRQQFPGGAQGGFGGIGAGNPFGGFSRAGGRLGIRISPPSSTLAEQLDLPKGQGIVVEDVQTESAAAKAGIKNNDILLELNGKNVPANPADFLKLVEDVKAEKPVDAVVLRKGKRESIKGLTLPEVKAELDPRIPFKGFQGGAGLQPPAVGFGGPPAGFGGGAAGGLAGAGVGGVGFAGGNQVVTSVFRTDDRFTTRHQEGSLIITVTGTIDNSKAKVSTINVQDGRESHKYESVDKVAEQYRDKVASLVEMSEKSGGKVELKTPKIKE